MHLGIDFGGSHIKYGLVDNNQMIACEQFSLQGMTFGGILNRTADHALSMLHGNHIELSQLEGLAIALPGVVNSHEKKLIAINDKYLDALSFDFVSWSMQNFGMEADVFNDAKMALMGEVYSGVAKGHQDVSMVIVGTGIGTAVMMNGQVLKSRNHTAGNLGGHFLAQTDGVKCSCGNHGCVEAYVSNSILHERVHQQWDLSDSALSSVSKIDYKAIFDRYETEKKAKQIGDSLIAHWAGLVVNMLHAYDSEVVILSGGVFNSKIDIRQKIEDYVNNNAWLPKNSYKLVHAENPSYSVLLGAESKNANYFIQ